MQAEQQSHNATGCPASGQTALPTEFQGALGHQLKQVYGQLLSEPLPDKFSQLLADLSKQGK